MTNFDLEMQKALEADGEKLRQLTGEDHGPFSIDDLAERCGDFEVSAVVAGPVSLIIDQRLVERVRSGAQTLAIVPAAGPAKAPRYVCPAIAKEGDTLELYAECESCHGTGLGVDDPQQGCWSCQGQGRYRLLADALIRCSYVQAVSMQRNPDYSMVGRERAAFPCYLSEEKALSEMDGFPSSDSDAARFAHYCKDGKPFNGHIIHWTVSADGQA